MKYEFTEQQLKNLMVFLARVDIKGSTGFTELQAMNEILNVLNNPIVEEKEIKGAAGGGAGSMSTSVKQNV